MSSEGDVYGQVHPDESPDLNSKSLKELELEVSKIADEEKDGYKQAVKNCPELLDDDFKLMFLRCEVFNVDLAAKRLVNYWNKRVTIFGPDKAFLPLTLDGAFKDDAVALGLGFAKIIPGVKDPSGRTLVFIDPSVQDRTLYTRESFCRSVWYVMHAALEDEVTQKKGIVFIGWPKQVKLSQFDRPQMQMNVGVIKGCIPLRVSAMHMCHPPGEFFFNIIFPIIKRLMGERLRKRMRLYTGSDEAVLKELADPFGLTADMLPTQLGGQIVLDNAAWLEERKALESGNKAKPPAVVDEPELEA
mmetsp:Transcript_38654/g.57478  ORF Transcript_38654/g.57478 Transcript_38654/m.57478 type:complete len:302 (-) Transcript_38654:149-1054(-)|eukprot:CAMPEP_0194048246 /NCGR_PEP_ID=MMETSP0009_2-20130614/26807_1 /TAXON_ID=210454 /ORGANISM="Grammatophora oceanica, Strain CCMP 410" /LENGTH=301 /DNA_ID=CAMNT_0038694067 /DNA_START=64 /DNA_END=972 /DNA_ORIENTATION=+